MRHKDAKEERAAKVVIHVAYPLWRKHAMIAFARAKELQDDGADVVVSYCSATSGTCAVNLAGSPAACAICRSRVQKTARANGVTLVPLDVTSPDPPLKLSEKKEIVEGVYSTVISTFRQLRNDGDENPLFRAVKRRYYRTACGLLSAMKVLLDRAQPVRIEVFNGRHACSKFSLVAARGLGIPFNTLEVNGKAKPMLFQGHTAHDRFCIQARMRSLPVNMDLAREYFRQRRQPSVNKFTKRYSPSFRPPDVNQFRKKVTFFLSSQDEFESLGRDWRSPFPDFAEVVQEACLANPDHFFCVRFHPNQADMISDVTTPFESVRRLPNAVVYSPTDTADSYTLIEWSDVVVTFGSMVTVEACWMGKPTIMLGPSFYDQLDVSLNPQTMDEFLRLLREDLQACPAENAAVVAMYQECGSDVMRYVGHDGRKMISAGIKLRRRWLSRIARTSDNVFCRLVKGYLRWCVRKNFRGRGSTAELLTVQKHQPTATERTVSRSLESLVSDGNSSQGAA